MALILDTKESNQVADEDVICIEETFEIIIQKVLSVFAANLNRIFLKVTQILLPRTLANLTRKKWRTVAKSW